MRVAWTVWLSLVVGCTSELGGPSGSRDAGGGGGADAGEVDAGARDAGAADAGASTDDASISGVDAGGPSADAGPSCVPARTSCNPALECGPIPDGCPGGVYACEGVCSDGVTYCAILPSRWHDRVYGCTQSAQAMHPEWFDPVMFRDTSSWLVLDGSAVDYVAFVAACADGGGAVCIVDSNAPGNEVRARGTDDDLAENLLVRTYGTGRTVTRYTSTCTPAMF